MIAGRRWWNGAASDDASALAKTLGRYTRQAPQIRCDDRLTLIASSRDHIGSAQGGLAAFTGWIDNAAELQQRLDLDTPDPAQIYAASLSLWGRDADRHIVGSYAAIAQLKDGSLHLARSPWDAPPLYYHCGSDRAVASPLLRVLFEAGAPREVDHDRIVDELAYDWRSGDDEAWYKGIFMVPLGASVGIAHGKRDVQRWYKPPSPGRGDDYDEAATVAEARRLLDEAARKALDWAKAPAVTLSGGLDSTLVTASLLEALSQDGTLSAITFVPDRNWQGECPPGTMGDERDLAGLFARGDPRIDWHIASDDIGPADRHARAIFGASETFAPGLANVGMYHGVYEKARALGCDTLLTADFGNSTFSEAGRYAYCEYLKRGKWQELARLLAARADDDRPMWRRVLALSVLPNLPASLRGFVRGLAHPARRKMAALVTPLSAKALALQASRAAKRGTASAWSDFTYDRTRAEAVQREWRDADGPGRDVDLAFEQLYAVRKRDVTAYRPLIEFCCSLPTEAFARQGVERRLARVMGEGRIPDQIRGNRLHGLHNADWHARMSPARDDMLEVLDTARSHPFLGEVLDIERLTALIEDWPERPGYDWEHDWPRMLALPRAILAARFIGHVENRNDL